MGTQLPLPKGAQPPIFCLYLYLSHGDHAPPHQKGGGRSSPQIFGPCLLWPDGWMDEAGILGMEVGLSPGAFVLDGDPEPLPQKGAEPPPQFSAHFYCGQTARCIKNQDATWYGCRPQPMGLCVRWTPSPPPQKGRRSPPQKKSARLLWPNGWMDQDDTWHGGKA